MNFLFQDIRVVQLIECIGEQLTQLGSFRLESRCQKSVLNAEWIGMQVNLLYLFEALQASLTALLSNIF